MSIQVAFYIVVGNQRVIYIDQKNQCRNRFSPSYSHIMSVVYYGGLLRGRSTKKVEPLPSLLSAQTRPPWRVTNSLTRYSPMPNPLIERSKLLARKKRSKMCGSSSAAMPTP